MPVTISGTNGVTFPDSSLQAAAASPYVLKNRIINGAMVIDQRRAGASVTVLTTTGYTLDRFDAVASVSSKYSVQQNAASVTPPSGYTNYLGVTSLSAYTVGASENFGIRQMIEGFNVADLGWGAAGASTVTLSFWVRSSLTGTFGGALANNTATRSYPFTYTISAANTWEQKTITIAGDTTGTWEKTSSIGIRVNFGLGSGASASGTAGAWAGADYFSATGATSVVGTNGATWYVTGVQLEVGTSATPFERRLYNQELANCQRYYWKTFVVDTAAAQNIAPGNQIFNICINNISNGLYFPVSMRATPTITTFNPYAANSSFRVPNSSTDVAVTPLELSASGIVYFSMTRTAPSALHGHITASSEL